MHLIRLKETDLFGIFFFKGLSSGKLEGYYATLNALRPLLKSNEWLQNATGFYINITKINEDLPVRLSYFTDSPKLVKEIVKNFVIKFGLKFACNSKIPHKAKVSEQYGGEELRFRKYLSTYTQIGLDIMKADILNAQCLLATFRFQVMRARKPYKSHFIKTFESQSTFYNALSEDEKEEFWKDLSNWPNPPQVDWAHMFVNMVLGCDWNSQEAWHTFLTPQPPLPISEINRHVAQIGFQIPGDWSPS